MPNPKIKYLLLANYINLFGFAFFAPLYALFVTELGASPQVVGLSAGIGIYASALMILFFGKLENAQKNKEKMVVLGFFWLAFAAASYMFVEEIWQLFLVQVLNAIGIGILTPALKAVYAQSEDKGKETQEWSFFDGGNALFIATGAALGGFLLTALGSFKSLFAVIALIQLVGALVSIKILKPTKQQLKSR